MTDAGSVLVGALERAWRAIQEQHAQVPDAVVVVSAGSGQRAGELKLGHFAAHRWVTDAGDIHELLIGGEGLRRGAVAVLGTLLHEAAHGLAEVRNLKDTSRQGRYHNRRYAQLAEEMGLHVQETGSIGWSETTPRETTVATYASILADLTAAIVLWRREEAAGSGRTKDPSRNLVAAVCPCGRKIRVALSTLADAPIVCGSCDGEFEPPETQDPDPDPESLDA